jgi:GH24 family phage-related lysozyme (muramidase)
MQAEGFSNEVYEDHLGNRTIGIGHRLKQGEPDYMENAVIMEYFKLDINTAVTDFVHVYSSSHGHLNEERVAVILECLFCLGRGRFLQFDRFIHYSKRGDFDRASYELINSRWWQDEKTRDRVESLAKRFKRG